MKQLSEKKKIIGSAFRQQQPKQDWLPKRRNQVKKTGSSLTEMRQVIKD